MVHASEDECNKRNGPTEHEHSNDIQATANYAVRAPELDHNCHVAVTSSTVQNTVPKHQQQACSNNHRESNSENLALERERRAFRPEHRERDNKRGSPSVRLPEYRDDRDSAIIHSGVVGTHEGKTFIPKRSVHRNALDDLAHPYGEDQDYFVLDLNLNGDQIDDLISNSKIYDARGGYLEYSAAECKLLTCPSVDQRNDYQNSTTSQCEE